MNETEIDGITGWTIDQGLAGIPETELLNGFCDRCRRAGLDLSRGLALIDTLHPIYEGRAYSWRVDGVEGSLGQYYGRTNEGEAAERWQRSTFHHVMSTGASELRQRLSDDEPSGLWPLASMREEGETDYVAFVHRFASEGAIGEMDCVYSHWTTRHPEGFTDGQLAALRRLVPALALAIKCGALARIAGTLVEVYLGRDAGRRVLGGRISRGVADRISAVLWYSDLRGYTTISDTAAPGEIIPLLNDYADAVVSAVHEAGGDVLKLIGDGVLAVFEAEYAAEACRSALFAEADLRRRIMALNDRRAAEGRPVTSVYLGLHVGDVFYGNIGSEDRLDFTVVGPAVNEVARIASMCRSADRGVLMSSEFAARVPERERLSIVSVGRYALRGIGRAQELFTLDPAMLS